VIFIVGFFIIQWSGGIGAKYVMIAIISFGIIMTLYEVLVRRVAVLRILFGLKTIYVSKKMQSALCATTGIGFIVVIALLVVSSTAENMSPPPTKPGYYMNRAYGFQLTFPAEMNRPGNLGSFDTLFHIRHPNETLYLKIRKNAISANQPLDPLAAKEWIRIIMKRFHMEQPEVLSTRVFTTPDGTKVLHANIQFRTRHFMTSGAYAFFNRNGKRFFIACYDYDSFETLEQIVKSLVFR
jgi:hypothetical protein